MAFHEGKACDAVIPCRKRLADYDAKGTLAVPEQDSRPALSRGRSICEAGWAGQARPCVSNLLIREYFL
jgi:hypothetical protein